MAKMIMSQQPGNDRLGGHLLILLLKCNGKEVHPFLLPVRSVVVYSNVELTMTCKIVFDTVI